MIAHFRRPESLVVQIPTYTRHVIPQNLAFSQKFSSNGHKYDFGVIAPAGYTFDLSASNTGVSGATNFPEGLVFAGDCLAVASPGQD